MDWPRVKTLLLVLLLVANLLLGGLSVQRHWAVSKEQTRSWQAWRQTFLSMGIALDDSLRPIMDTQIYALYLPRPEEKEQALALFFLGDVSFRDLGGHVFEYAGSAGTGRFRAGSSFDIRLKIPTPLQKRTPAEQAKADIVTAELDAYPLTAPQVTEREGNSEITCRQIVQGCTVYNSQLSFSYGNGGLQSVGGTFLLAPVSRREPEPSLTAGSLLIQFVQTLDNPVYVNAMEWGYVLVVDGSDLWKLQPVCQIAVDGQEYLLDADAGALMVENLEKLTIS